MPYSLTKLTTAAECDAVLKQTQSKLRELNYQTHLLTHEQEEAEENATTLEMTLIGVNAGIIGYNSQLAALPPGSDMHNKMQSKLRDATNRQVRLTERKETKGSIALLVHELDMALIQAQITEVTDFAAAVTARKAAL